jgi:aryl-alcohol dehydrogenase-like predicted oxidoreductase
MNVSRISVGGFPFGAVNVSQGWNPYSDEGKKTAIRTIHTALDLGINYIDTAPGYGNGYSERIIGVVLKERRDECYVATKVEWRGLNQADVIRSVEESLKRLQTDSIDVIQFHGGFFTKQDYDYILQNGPLEALVRLKEQGKIKWIGLATEEPYSILDFLHLEEISIVQVCYNFIYQSAALHLLDKAKEHDLGVAVMRPMTSGIMQRIFEKLEANNNYSIDFYQLCLKYLLSDPRVNVINIGMRWSKEVIENVRLVTEYDPIFDISTLPRSTAKIYETE